MMTIADTATPKVVVTKNLVTEQNYSGMTFKLTGGRAFIAGGLGVSGAAASCMALVNAGGFPDQKMAATMYYTTGSTSGNEDFGVMVGFQSAEVTGDTYYYYARCSAGLAKLTRVNGGTFTNLSTQAFAVAINIPVIITLQRVGNALQATFSAPTNTPPLSVTLNAVDSSVATGGLMGWRTLSSTGICSSYQAEQL
jgi:hypothetical protein